MNVVLYSTGCPKCQALSAKLNNAGIDYEIETDVAKMCDLGFMSVPMLSVDGQIMDYTHASDWINKI